MASKYTSIYVPRVSKETYRKLKAVSALEKSKISDVVLRAIEAYVWRYKFEVDEVDLEVDRGSKKHS